MNVAWSTHGKVEKCIKMYLENLKVRDHLGDREVDKKVILRWIFEKNV
jgi:hypothetical protein